MHLWRIWLPAVAAVALLGGEVGAASFDDLGRQSPAQAAPDLAADDGWDVRGVLPLGGEVGPASPELEDAVVPTVVPEPTTLVLVSLGMVGLVFAGRRRTAHAIAAEDASY